MRETQVIKLGALAVWTLAITIVGQSSSAQPPPTRPDVVSIAVADIFANVDGDIVIAHRDGRMFFHDLSSGWLELPVTMMSWTGQITAGGDISGDNLDDLLFFSTQGMFWRESFWDTSLSISANLAQGKWDYIRPYPPGWSLSVEPAPGIPASNPMASGDLSGDNLADVVVAGSSGIWWRDSAGYSGWQQIHGSYSPGISSVAVGDITGDGREEVVAYFNNDGLWWRDAPPGGTWHRIHGNYPPGVPYLAAGDITGDGNAEVLAYFSGDGLWWRDSPPGGTWHKIEDTFPGVPTRQVTALAVGDLYGDAREEIVIASRDFHGVRVFLPLTGVWWNPGLNLP